ncbi:pyruvate formate lyase activating enzyme [Selenomonas sp. GACV-9]|uniref:glycyl-radical enzyme activating protein n=1 Tax=Selenomonas sp. GACV-9 TaxID=3158782 RepID=UPI0008E3018F|nr:pyruvate formate lyase activating enzyme [Selenomonas ruminantium]
MAGSQTTAAAQELCGLIFNIQKFSTNDGPGVRTTVFFKGCPLRCRWCANPESQDFTPEVLCHAETGKSETTGTWRTVDEVISVCLQDLPFYEESGGGVTLSGGEVLSQPDFAIALLQALQEKGIHTAIETSGFAQPATFRQVAGLSDLLLFDMKHWDGDRHLWGTGVTNELPLANMRTAIADGLAVLPRIPIIPGFNDTTDDAHGFARRLREVGADRCQLLPFHPYGENKYQELGRPYEYTGQKALRPEALQPLIQVLQEEGIDTFL